MNFPASFPASFSRRALLLGGAFALAGRPASAIAAAPASMPAPLRFPRDFGAHVGARTEWWYITGHALHESRRYGFQITFFRSRVAGAQALQSSLAARQLVFAHAAVSDIAAGRLLHDQRMGRWSGLPPAQDGFGQAWASSEDTDLRLGAGRDVWSLRRLRDGYRARAACEAFALDVDLIPTQPLLLQGDAGLSQKGPRPEQNSRYYSVPQLRVRGGISIGGRRMVFDAGAERGQNAAWLDHEWSDEIMPPGSVGWDWTGINGFDGFALTLFRLRRADGSALWAGGSWRASGAAEVQVFAADAVRFEAVRWWVSPRTGGRYPVEFRLQTPAGRFTIRALLDDQELDSRASTGAVYWEGLSELLDASGRAVGRGYLELTGYLETLRL